MWSDWWTAHRAEIYLDAIVSGAIVLAVLVYALVMVGKKNKDA